MSFTGREVISGDDLPKADDFAVASAIQLTQKKTRGGGGGGTNPKPRTGSQEHCKTKLCMRARGGKAVQIKDEVESSVWSA